MHRLTIMLALALVLGLVEPPTGRPARRPVAAERVACPCAELLDMTIRRVEDTYIAYRLEVTDEGRPVYEARKEASRQTCMTAWARHICWTPTPRAR
jgi:hypothetical protein